MRSYFCADPKPGRRRKTRVYDNSVRFHDPRPPNSGSGAGSGAFTGFPHPPIRTPVHPESPRPPNSGVRRVGTCLLPDGLGGESGWTGGGLRERERSRARSRMRAGGGIRVDGTTKLGGQSGLPTYPQLWCRVPVSWGCTTIL